MIGSIESFRGAAATASKQGKLRGPWQQATIAAVTTVLALWADTIAGAPTSVAAARIEHGDATGANPATVVQIGRQDAGTTITVLMPPFAQMPKSQLAKFTAETGIKVTEESLSFLDLHTRVVTAELAGKAPADVTDLDWSWVGQFGAHHWYTNLQGLIPKGLIKGSPVSADFLYNGAQVGLPYDLDLRGSIVNMTILKQAGIGSPPETWNQVIADAEALKAKGIVKYPVALRLSATEGTSTAWYALTMAAGGSLMHGTTPVFTSPSSPAGQALQFMAYLYQHNLVAPGSISFQEGQAGTQYEDGLAAIYLSASPGTMGSLDTYPKIKNDVHRFIPMPSPRGHNRGTLTLPDGFGIPSQVTGKVRQAAAMWMEWWLQPPQQMLDYSDPNLGNLPTEQVDLKTLIEAGKVQPGVLEALSAARPLFVGGTPAWYPSFSDDASSMIQSVVEGHLSVSAGLARLASEARSLAA